MTLPNPSLQNANIGPDRPSIYPNGQESRVSLDTGSGPALIAGKIWERPERMNSGVHGDFSSIYNERSHLDAANNVLPVGGAATVTVGYLGPLIPYTLEVTISDNSTFPAVETVSTHAMGSSNDTQSIVLGADDTLIKLRALRRF